MARSRRKDQKESGSRLRMYVVLLLIGVFVGYVIGSGNITGKYVFTSDWTKIKQCNNGVDDDGDGWIDWPNDIGCESKVDNTEYSQDNIVYQCSDRIDNDNDGRVDYPADLQCKSPTDTSELYA